MGTSKKTSDNNYLSVNTSNSGTNKIGDQQHLFRVDCQIEIDDVEMGVLESGVPYLTGRGLERMCGLGRGPFVRLTNNWSEEKLKPRGIQINEILEQNGYFEDELYLKAEYKGREINAFTEPVCLAMLEYYAFVVEDPRPQAIQAFRNLARLKFRDFVYQATGYSPNQKQLDSWKFFHDRVDLTISAVPDGYFGVFNEAASLIVPMIRSGIIVSDKVIPDISVGMAWSKHWKECDLEKLHGKRINYQHNYPEYYPQAQSNPQAPYAYPLSCIGEFRRWLKDQYINTQLPKYLLGQAKKGSIQAPLANQVLEALSPKQLK
ncbi:hypothetical protein RFH95_11485 [Acinetobacter nosocomialis]|nr:MULTISPECIES: hypothetical protein [Acinetobacter calcoaceticus/baumannii complex]EHU2215502.1 hypothetical protein [Acinetobacter baumannii]KQD43447.1 hypothetical protein APD15_07565 [Acinetobacter baumannii]KRI04214.1 hypothetical protein APC63_14305 [Acinetobacter baumannii]KRI11844.1 hypothetical protein APC85_04640 [Acinetobacter baumannii]KRI30451.1 hypothetical protein APB98_11265 [Acinetobacter baumannii]